MTEVTRATNILAVVNHAPQYRGRIAPSPTGYLHLGHARTFWTAYERARENRGVLVFRNEDLDPQRSRPQFVDAMYEDLRWFGIKWQEGPDVGGPYAPYSQSDRRAFYLEAWRKLLASGALYACTCSRKDLASAAQAPHELDDEPIYPGTCRDRKLERVPESPAGLNWRFRIPDGETISFPDERLGNCQYTAGKDFGDFVVWRRDDVPAYQLAVVADDEAMKITEVVRGEDLLRSTARQILLRRALGYLTPRYYHCALVVDSAGQRLAKRHDSLSLRSLRAQGIDPATLRNPR